MQRAGLLRFAGSGLTRNNSGNACHRARQNVAGQLNVNLIGNRSKMGAKRCGDRNGILDHSDRRRLGIARQCQQNIFEGRMSLLCLDGNLARRERQILIHRKDENLGLNFSGPRSAAVDAVAA
jgi:hypothetical protein